MFNYSSINKWLVFSIFIFSGQVFAEPTGLLRKMMETQISMFSYGMDKLNAEVKSSVNKHGWFGTTSYDWNTNQITIFYRNFNAKTCSSEKTCFEAIKKIDESSFKYWCLSTNNNGTCDILDSASYIFIPTGFSIKNFHDGKSSDIAILDVKNHISIKGEIFINKKKYTCVREYTSQSMMCGVE